MVLSLVLVACVSDMKENPREYHFHARYGKYVSAHRKQLQ